MQTTIGEQKLTVLGEFKPFGLIAESFDGKPLAEDGVVSSASSHKYDYFLFDPQIARERDNEEFADSAFSDRSDHELFIHGNRIIWSAGSRVYKRFTLPSSILMACWCHLGDMSEAVLCVLQTNSLTIYNISGEITCVPLPQSVMSIWPLPCGLLLEQASKGTYLPNVSPSQGSGVCDLSCMRGDMAHSPYFKSDFVGTFDQNTKGDTAFISSHLILRDPLEEPQCTYIEERGKINIMMSFDERAIWTSNQVPLMASYNRGKMQHSVWVVEAINSNFEEANMSLSDAVPAGISQKNFSFRRIWQAKGAQSAAGKVFLATDDDATPVICFHLQEQNKLLAVRLRSDEINSEIIFDIKPDMSWTIPAIAAAPVIVTRPSVKIGLLSYTDIIALSPENILLLYSGKQCLYRYMLPTFINGNPSMKAKFPESASGHCKKIIGLSDAVGERVNVVLNNGQVFRCALRRSPSCSLVNDCITAMAVGLKSTSYNQFLFLLWGNGYPDHLLKADSETSLEWTHFCSIIMEMCEGSSVTSQKHPLQKSCLSWEFLVDSKFHNDYKKLICIADTSSEMSIDEHGPDSCKSATDSLKGRPHKSYYYELLVESLDSLHAVYESLKLDNLRRRDVGLLAALLCRVADFLGETNYLDHYIRDLPSLSKKFGAYKASLSHKHPPNLFRWLESCLRHGCQSVNICDLPLLLCKDGSNAVNWARKTVSFYSLLFGAKMMGKKLSSGVHCNVASGSCNTNEELAVLAMVGERFGLQQLDLLPSGVSLPLRHALDKCRESPPIDWPAAAYVLIGRQDLAMSRQAHCSKSIQLGSGHNFTSISMSTPYMLQLHPVTIPSAFSDTIGLDNSKFEDVDSVDGSVTDGMEHIFNSSTQLQYSRDLRLNEVRRVLCSARPVAIQTSVNPGASDQDLQQAQLWHLAQRTTALPFGRGAFTLATIYTLLTEAFTVPKLVLAGRLPAQQNATVNLDPNVRNIQELKCWPEFHNAVAAGLRLAPLQGKMSRPWIAYNRPEEPSVAHAGLLLALGLHGYLRVLNITDIYQYCQQEHESTTVGLLLGLAASYRGTMDPAISKSLYVHVPARHPSSYPELEIPTVMQSAALMSVGLLYEGSVHPQTMQILLGEIGRRSGGDSVLEREGYAVSAGFALGLVALGRGEDSFGFMGSLVDRLFHYIGGKEPFNEKSFFWTPSSDERNRGTGQVMDETAVNVDVTAPGAIIALALIFMKTESEVIVSRLPIPRTRFELQYVRPDFIMLRVIARNLIIWSRIHASKDWIESQLPEIVRTGMKCLRDNYMDIDDADAEAFVQAYVNIVTGACISLGLRYAGTRNGHAQELLYEYAVYFLNEIKPVSAMGKNDFPKGLANYVDRGTLEICLHLIILSLSVVMAGSGHLETFRLLRFLRCRNCPDGQTNYGIQMAVSLAIGFLFLGGGMRTFSTNTSSIAALLITLYPRLPTGPNDNRCHLQAFRHLYVLATEARWIQTVDVDSGLPVHVPLEVTIKETEHYAETSFCEITPCVIPERSVLKRVCVCGPRYWSRVIEVNPEDEPWWSIRDSEDPFKSGMLHVKRKVGACSYVDDPIGCQSLLSRALHKVFCLTSMRGCDPAVTGDGGSGYVTVDQLVSTFSSDPSLIAFAQLCCDPSWTGRSDGDFQEYCLQVLFECVSKDRPALLQVYLSLYATIESMAHQVTRGTIIFSDSLAVTNLKLALSYIDAQLGKNLTPLKGGIIQPAFLGSLRKRVEEVMNCFQGFKEDLHNYLVSERWPGNGIQSKKNSVLLAWYLQWYGVPTPSVIRIAVRKINPKLTLSSSVPLLRLLFPSIHITAISEMDELLFSSQI